MYQLEERDREIQEAKSQAAKLPQIAARLYTAEQRTKQLEQLCRDLWNWDTRSTKGEELHKRMTDLGLLDGEQ